MPLVIAGQDTRGPGLTAAVSDLFPDAEIVLAGFRGDPTARRRPPPVGPPTPRRPPRTGPPPAPEPRDQGEEGPEGGRGRGYPRLS
jgi:hypothetical protein